MRVFHGLVLAVVFVIAAVAMFPLRVVWDAASAPADLSVSNATGTVWSGRLETVTWRGVALGDFDAALSPLDLLHGPAARLSNGSGPLKSARLHASGGSVSLSEAIISVRLADLVSNAPAELIARISDGAVDLREGVCISAAGRIEAPPAPSLGLPAFRGDLSCEGGAFLARMESETGQAVLELGPALDRIGYRSASPTLAIALAAIGIPAAMPGP